MSNTRVLAAPSDLRVKSMYASFNLSRHCPLFKLELSGIHHGAVEECMHTVRLCYIKYITITFIYMY